MLQARCEGPPASLPRTGPVTAEFLPFSHTPFLLPLDTFLPCQSSWAKNWKHWREIVGMFHSHNYWNNVLLLSCLARVDTTKGFESHIGIVADSKMFPGVAMSLHA